MHMDPSKRKDSISTLPAATVSYRSSQLQAFSAARSESLSALSARRVQVQHRDPSGSQGCLSALPARQPLSVFSTAVTLESYGSVQKEDSLSTLPATGRQKEDCLLVPSARYRPSKDPSHRPPGVDVRTFSVVTNTARLSLKQNESSLS
jgi:hypothetical protein